ncbi:adenosylcobinamide-phosphate synthase CbiB [Limnothrix sp. PR1529]|uniref:adenosylcobinamide-phosphate synthase CbiB n=1 Tax=Limnothrix sp. PR1529 TaxID=1704291 RepID=UPI001F2D6F16|nr:adenosylcobinamide-phosphate synthase CbiB [Limnothrix sp. PR1529]
MNGLIGMGEPTRSILVLGLAAVIDWLVGDPWSWVHPVQVIGAWIDRYRRWAWSLAAPDRVQRWLGVGLALSTIGGAGALAGAIGSLACKLNPILGLGVEAVMVAACFAGRSLRDAAEDVLEPLAREDLPEARSRLSRYVGRETEHLDRPEILRAVLETVAENAVDGVLGPLFWALVGAGAAVILGWGSGAIAAVALGYKAASTLDSMVGYKDSRHRDLGWFSARLEDHLTWLPCRLTVGSIALISRKPLQVWGRCRRDGALDPSPNSGWSECAYAMVLGVQLGGENRYRGQVKYKPLLGDPQRPIEPETVRSALGLTRVVFLGWLCGAIGLLALGFLP